MKIVDRLVAAAKQQPSKAGLRIAKILPVFVFFFFFLPLLFIVPHFVFDRWLGFSPFFALAVRAIPGLLLIIPGLYFLYASTKAQREIGKGTPMPLNATQNLVVEKPYSYCRNPLYFGLIAFFFGISILIGSISSLGMVALFSIIILLYIKFIEEQELLQRYGDEYLAYKEKTPMLIPRLSFHKTEK